MNEFWLWFWRPIAEFMSAIAFLAAIIVVLALVLIGHAIWQDLAGRWKRLRGVDGGAKREGK